MSFGATFLCVYPPGFQESHLEMLNPERCVEERLRQPIAFYLLSQLFQVGVLVESELDCSFLIVEERGAYHLGAIERAADAGSNSRWHVLRVRVGYHRQPTP